MLPKKPIFLHRKELRKSYFHVIGDTLFPFLVGLADDIPAYTNFDYFAMIFTTGISSGS